MRSNQRIRDLEAAYGIPLRALLVDLHYKRGLTQRQIAVLLGVPEGTIPGWFMRLGIGRQQLADERAKELVS